MKHNNYSARKAALRWRSANVYSRWMLGRIPRTRQLHLRYEDLCYATEDTVKRLCEFISVAYEPAMLKFRIPNHHLIGGNDMRTRSDTAIVEDTSWRKQMSEHALATFEKIGGRMNRKLLGEYFDR